jgi:hypothetical protein
MKTRSSARIITLGLLTAVILSACGLETPASNLPEPTVADPQPTLTSIPTEKPAPTGYITYLTQSGDTLPVVAAHFGLEMHQVKYDEDLDREALLPPGTRLYVRDLLDETTEPDNLFLDSDVVFSPSTVGFDILAFAEDQGGFLAQLEEQMTRGSTPAAQIVHELALEHSINPRILLSLMEYESGWVTRKPADEFELSYPFGWEKRDRTGTYFQTGWAITQLSQGYYGWRDGSLTELTLTDGTTLRLSPFLNAGTVAVMYTLAQIHDRAEWEAALYGPGNLVDVHLDLFGDPQARANGVEPLFPAGTEQPLLNLPIPVNEKWNLTGGPHSAWGRYGPRAALDFAPPLDRPGCGNSQRWTTAAAAGRVVRAGNGVVVLDLDMDGYEQTGWVLVYMHVANSERVQVGDVLAQDDRVGHPSCEGGSSSGIHIHIARKFNGEWVLADGGLPFVMSGYRAKNGDKPCDYAWWGWCEGSLSNGEYTAVADPFGNFWTRIIRPESRPEFFYTPTPKK